MKIFGGIIVSGTVEAIIILYDPRKLVPSHKDTNFVIIQ